VEQRRLSNMIILNDIENVKSIGFSYTFSNCELTLNISSKVEDVFVFYHQNNHLKLVVNVEEFGQAELVEIIEENFDNCEFTSEVNSKGILNHVILSKAKINDFKMNNNVKTTNDGNYNLIYLDFNSGNAAINNTIDLNNQGNEGNIYLASVVNNSEVKNIINTINNNANNTNGYMSNYGVSFDTGRLKIKGVGAIVKGASKSKSNQKSVMYVMDETSYAASEPILLIDEDEVEASHASAVGEIDENTIFYLCSRGLKKSVARKLIVLGEFKTLINLINSLEIRNLINDYLSEVINNV